MITGIKRNGKVNSSPYANRYAAKRINMQFDGAILRIALHDNTIAVLGRLTNSHLIKCLGAVCGA